MFKRPGEALGYGNPRRNPLQLWLGCRKCNLHKYRRQVVLGRGTIPAELLFVGEAPGRSEDLTGEAFVGRAGRILDAAIADATRLAGRENPPSYYITNTVGCIPRDEPRGPFREPENEEILACWPRLELTWHLVQPTTIILLGNVARDACAKRFPEAVALRHPAYLLRRGGTASGEYRTFARELSEVFRVAAAPVLGPKDIFGDRICGTT